MNLQDFIEDQNRLNGKPYIRKHRENSTDINEGFFDKLKAFFKSGTEAFNSELKDSFAQAYPKWYAAYQEAVQKTSDAKELKKKLDELLSAIDQMKKDNNGEEMTQEKKDVKKFITASGIRTAAEEKKLDDVVKYCDKKLEELTKTTKNVAELAKKEMEGGGSENNEEGVPSIDNQDPEVQKAAKAAGSAGLGDQETLNRIASSLATLFGIGKNKSHSKKKNESLSILDYIDIINEQNMLDLLFEEEQPKPEDAKKETGLIDELRGKIPDLVNCFKNEGTKKLNAFLVLLAAYHNIVNQQGINEKVIDQINIFLSEIAKNKDFRFLIYGKK